MDNLSCISNNYLTIFQCSFSTIIDSECTNTNSYDATVYCCEYKHFPNIIFVQILLGSGTVILSMVRYVFKEVIILIKDVWRSTVMDNGEQYAIMDLVLLMLKLSVNNWDITITIDMIISICE